TARTPKDAAPGTKDPYPRVIVQVGLRCGMGELSGVLHALESGSPQLFVDNLDILSRRSYLAAGNEGGGALDVSFDLYGYLNAVEAAPRA
ncbi:MAG TPA: type II secretion system protein GspM, partial [Kofleriaceae bacterium]|nr:type II secretion system protein GspM [Kofleriaceae bacterium]